MKKKKKKKSRIRAVECLDIQRNEELFEICLRTVKATSVGATSENNEVMSSSRGGLHNRDLNLTISWIESEKSVFMDEKGEAWQRDNIFNDETLWGVSHTAEGCQSVHPSEWDKGDESSDHSHAGTSRFTRKREREEEREEEKEKEGEREREGGLCGGDILHSNHPIRPDTNSHDSSKRTEHPNGHDIRSCSGMDLDPYLESACVLYKQTLRFFTDLQRLLLRLGSTRSSSSSRSASMPFDCSLLISRIKRIMILMSKK